MTTSQVRSLDTQSFHAVVRDSQQPVLVDFYADWCPPCKALEPTVKALAQELADSAVVAKVDVDANPELAEAFNIRSIPTLLLFRGGEVVARFVGIASKQELAGAIESASAGAAA